VWDYGELAEIAMGPWLRWTVDASVVLNGFGALLSYFVTVATILADIVQQVLDVPPWLSSYHFILAFLSFAVILPLIMVREFKELKCVSVFALLAISSVVLLVVIRGPSLGAELDQRPEDILWFSYTGLNKIGSVIFALGCGHATFHAYNGMQATEQTSARWQGTAAWAVILGACLCSVMGVMGYLSFGDATAAEILDNFSAKGEIGLAGSQTDWVSVIFKLVLVVHLLLYIPVDFLIMRHSFWLLCTRTNVLDLSLLAYIALGTCLVGGCFVVTWFLRDFGVILDLTGGVAGSVLYFIAPALVALKLGVRPFASWMLLSFGGCALILSLYFTVMGHANGT